MASADAKQRRDAVVAACKHAVAINAVGDAVAVSVLQDVCVGLGVSEQGFIELKALQELADAKYFESAELDGASHGQETLWSFTRARALSSLVFAVDSDSVAMACESIYEAMSSVDD